MLTLSRVKGLRVLWGGYGGGGLVYSVAEVRGAHAVRTVSAKLSTHGGGLVVAFATNDILSSWCLVNFATNDILSSASLG